LIIKQFFSKSIEIYKSNKKMKNIKTFFKSAGLAVLGGLWASQRQETNYVTEICMHGFNFLAVTSY